MWSLCKPLLNGLAVRLRKPTAAGSKLRGTGLPGGMALENSAEGARWLDLSDCRLMRKMARHMISPSPTTPPTVPPTIGPTLELDWVAPPASVDTGFELELEEADEVEESGGELVEDAADVGPPAEDSGCPANASASVALNRSSATMLIYAHAGTAVAPGMARG
jgi:hypothetical protein